MNKDNRFSHQLIANTIRGLAIDAIQKANSGHPGLPLGMADVATVLWKEHLRFNPKNPDWFNRDRFVLSGGHGSMLLYSLLHLFGYDLSLEDIRQFRQLGSRTPGHPEIEMTPGVETTTGPLGQGLANAVGMAIAEAHLHAQFAPVDHFTFVMAGDGDLQEGISHEVCALAGHLKLGKLILLFDSNSITIDGKTGLSCSTDIRKRFEAYGWHVQEIDGHDHEQIRTGINLAKENHDQPSIVICKTVIGYGSPNKAGTSHVHGSPLGAEEVVLTKKALGIPEDQSFFVPAELAELARASQARGIELEKEWIDVLKQFRDKDPEGANLFDKAIEKDLSQLADQIPAFAPGKALATRSASGKVLEYLVRHTGILFGGSADLTPSNNTKTSAHKPFTAEDYSGNYMHYGVREHGMGSIMNGIALHGGLIPYGGTFFVFSDYMKPAIRMAALMHQQVIFVLTHDSIGLGEDGPTHQPVEHLAALRAVPNLFVLRPADANETAEAWKIALERKNGPTCLVLSRQNLNILDTDTYPVHLASKGAYVLAEDPGFDRIIIASGSEVHLALQAKAKLNETGKAVRVVSMMSFELFEQQDEAYKSSVLPVAVKKRLAIESGSSLSWYKYTGAEGKILAMDSFGKSAPAEVLFDHFGFNVDRVIDLIG
ncbi:MAG TPA: transketolase [Saprospirales bacterium]|nr:transketolase [Saprospirales bacterium]HAY70868.1 transketolase [Saprospirales bacterium]HRQ29553.1 transketolase [Saprospiraceae bacterium]